MTCMEGYDQKGDERYTGNFLYPKSWHYSFCEQAVRSVRDHLQMSRGDP